MVKAQTPLTKTNIHTYTQWAPFYTENILNAKIVPLQQQYVNNDNNNKKNNQTFQASMATKYDV